MFEAKVKFKDRCLGSLAVFFSLLFVIPASADSTSSEPAKLSPLSVTIGGGVSLGSYQGGLLYYSIRHLKNYGLFNLKAVTGTSAGSVNGLIYIVEGCGETSKSPSGSTFYDTWIPVGLHRLLIPQRVTSTTLLVRDSFTKATENIRSRWMRGFSPECDLLFGISSTRKEPVNEEIRNGIVTKKHAETFVVHIKGRGKGFAPIIENVSDPTTSRVLLPFTENQEKNFDILADLIKASSAIPVAFSRQPISYCTVPAGSTTKYCDPKKADREEFLDGGFYDNAPIRLAHHLMDLQFGGTEEMDRAIFAVASVDNTAYPEVPPLEMKEGGILSVVGKLAGDFVATARTREMSTAFEENSTLRNRILTNAKNLPLAGEHLTEFLGFFDTDFRKYDFYLGMYDARYLLSRGLNDQRIRTRLKGARLRYPEEVFTTDTEWMPIYCLDRYLLPPSERQKDANSRCQLWTNEAGPRAHNFQALLQTSVNLLYSHCQSSEKAPNPIAHPLCNSVWTTQSSPPPIVAGFDPTDWRPRFGEEDFQYFMRQLGEYRYHFRDLGLSPEKSYLGMARLEQQLAGLVNAAASLQNWLEGLLVRGIGYYIIHSFTQRSSLIGFLMGVNTMFMTFALILGLGALLMVLERLFPARPLPQVDGWWGRVLIINLLQAGVVILGGLTWENWMMGASLFNLTQKWGVAWSSITGYLVITFVYYWWHRWRHDSHFLWLSMHQIHHSPRRIETITSFYKHPGEIFGNSLLISATLYPLLGLTAEAGAWVTVLTCYAEYFYHMNLRTPRWVGYFLQRPEMHRYHHEYDKHYGNFADLPLWDMIFGTYFNPRRDQETECGFDPHREARFRDMLFFKDVHLEVKTNGRSDGK